MGTELFDPIKAQSKITDTVLVAFSGGKDSVVTLDLCCKYFKRVIPFFMYIAPGLEFQEQLLTWYENKYSVKIIRIPHFEVSNFMRYGTFREYDLSVPIVSVTDVYSYLRASTEGIWVAAGERINDSIVRRAMIKQSGSIDRKRGRFYPVAYWTKRNVLDYISKKRLKLGIDSKELGFSFKSLDGKELSLIKKRFPDDYRRILNLYPFAEAAVRRYESYGN